MEDMRKTLESYEEGRRKLQERINELHGKISEAKDSDKPALSKRRYQLYAMLWEMELSMNEMREYLEDEPEIPDAKAS